MFSVINGSRNTRNPLKNTEKESQGAKRKNKFLLSFSDYFENFRRTKEVLEDKPTAVDKENLERSALIMKNICWKPPEISLDLQAILQAKCQTMAEKKILDHPTGWQDLSADIKIHIASYLDDPSKLKLLLANKASYEAVMANPFHIIVKNKKQLQKVLSIHKIDSLILKGGDFMNEDLKKLPPSLKKLAIRGCSGITEEGLENMPVALKEQLEELRLNCLDLNNLGPLKTFKNLKILILQRCDGITAEVFKDMPENLEKVYVHSCRNIADEGLQAVCGLPKLTELYLGSCLNITNTGLLYLKERKNSLLLTLAFLSGCTIESIKGLEGSLVTVNAATESLVHELSV